jgi:hypothetical protein
MVDGESFSVKGKGSGADPSSGCRRRLTGIDVRICSIFINKAAPEVNWS